MSDFENPNVLPEPEPAKPVEVFADYVDGMTASVLRMSIWSKPGAILLRFPNGDELTWPLDDLRELPDQADAKGIVVKPGHDSLERLIVQDPGIAIHIRENAKHLRLRPPVTNLPRIGAWASGAVASVALIIFVLVPIMANQLATYLPPEGERALGDATFEQIRAALSVDASPVSLCERPAGMAAMAEIERRLSAEDDLPYPVEIAVLDHELVNAFALPGGRVIVFRGLIDSAETAEEVTAVIAHEIGHVVNRDPTRDALRSAGSIGVLGLLFGDFAGGTVVLFLTNQLINAQYSQSAESGADTYAHGLLSRADIDPKWIGTFFQRMKDEHGDMEGFAAHLSSHPQMAARIEASAVASGGREYRNEVLTASQWSDLREICGVRDNADEAEGAKDDGSAEDDSDAGWEEPDTDNRRAPTGLSGDN
ncbi:M48 family metallopeptidase [Maritimibacter sp. DP1N21-5]|uniref:M48 family metallopeptidase n=1 Tax=Maritimibacter sp. DP1N21-5 TaxID=2836867 RepID=UPI001C4789B5|nr:M48 family metallopeptidase [Maritimibacter sp. DP1N21-5]MBV7408486.1 M48 family metallopeptidase [Maritimibacter sp. DP1N21-5]